jgi:hypothetical protein
MRGAISPLPQYVFMMWCLIKQWIFLQVWDSVKHRDKFTHLLLPYNYKLLREDRIDTAKCVCIHTHTHGAVVLFSMLYFGHIS